MIFRAIMIYTYSMYCSYSEDLSERKTWHANGQVCEHTFFRNNRREGTRRVWYSNGSINMEEFYRDGELEGECKWWYPNGRILSWEFYRNGKLNGKYRFWHENGQIYEIVTYLDGMRQGFHKTWENTGSPRKWRFHRNNKYYARQVFTSRHIDITLRLKSKLFSNSIGNNISTIDKFLIIDLVNLI